jgi:hypothetical protein
VSARIKDAFESFMKRYGRLISAAFILAVAAFVGNNARNDMPGREPTEVPAAPAAVAPVAVEKSSAAIPAPQ